MEFKERVIESYTELFGNPEGDRIAGSGNGFAEKWGWYQSIYALAQGDVKRFYDITNLNLHTCLQYLAFEKDKQDLEKQMFKIKK